MLDPAKYEYWVYQTLERNLSAGTVSANYSIDYKSLEADLQLSQPWETIKADLTQATSVPALQKDVHTLLEELQIILEALIERVNKRIETGENKEIRIKKKRRSNTLEYSLY